MGDILSISCDGQLFKFIYFQKCAYMFIMHNIITKMHDSSFSADDGGMMGGGRSGCKNHWQESHTNALNKDLMYTQHFNCLSSQNVLFL
jgi:hypothetical protein